MLAVVALMAGPLVVPVVAPAVGVALLRPSARWAARRDKRAATVLGLAPLATVLCLVLLVALRPPDDHHDVTLAARV